MSTIFYPKSSGSSIYSANFNFLFVLCFIFLCSCIQEREPKPQIVSLDENSTRETAKKIENSVSYNTSDSLEISLWASEKLLQDPIGLDITNDGTMYVSVTERRSGSDFDIRNHRDWMTESMSWSTVDDRRQFIYSELSAERSDSNKAWLKDFNNDGSHDWRDLTVQQERIYAIKDKSGDGVADFSQLYAKNFNTEMSEIAATVAAINNSIYVGIAPNIWRLFDSNSNGIADRKSPISSGYMVHIGFGGHSISGLTMGPDGRIYWGIGDIGSNITAPDGTKWHLPNQGAIFRSEPDGSNFEVFARGLRNTHEFVFDKYGNLISVDNDGDHAGEHERLVYLINGSDSGWRINWQFGKYSESRNNEYKVWMDEDYFKPRFANQAAHILPPLAAYHSGPAGMAYNPGTALSNKWENTFFVSEFRGTAERSAIHAFKLKPKGASFVLDSTKKIVEGILTTGMDFGPDGSLYFADWIEGWDTNDLGRIWKLDVPETKHTTIRNQVKRLLASSFSDLNPDSLLTLLRHQDMRIRTKAQFELADRGSTDQLLKAVEQKEYQLARIHGIWGIGQLARAEKGNSVHLIPYLNDTDAEIRAQITKVLGDVRYTFAANKIIPLLKDESARVQLMATEALGRMAYTDAHQSIINMLERNNDEDVYLRHAGAIALARIGYEEALGNLSEHPSKAVRIAAVVALKRMESPQVARFLDDTDEFIVTNAARAINDDALIKDVVPDLAKLLTTTSFYNEPLIRRSINANLHDGTGESAQRLAEFVLEAPASNNLKSEAAATLSVWDSASVLDRVTGRYRGPIMNNRKDAVDALQLLLQPILKGNNDSLITAVAKASGKIGVLDAAPLLQSVVVSNQRSDLAKVASLNALKQLNYPKLDAAVTAALEDVSSRVRMTALSLVPELDINNAKKVDLLAFVLRNENSTFIEKQSASTAISKIDHQAAEKVLESQLEKLVSGSLDPKIHLETIEAAEKSGSASLQKLISKYREQNADESLTNQYSAALYGGDRNRGARIFYNNESAACVRCHTIDGNGGNVGPRLSNIGNQLTRKQLLQAMVEPNARIAPGYGSVSVTLKNGVNIQGVLVESTDTQLTIREGDGSTHVINKKNIAKQVNAPSSMYSMVDRLDLHQLRDLIAFLNEQKAK